MCTVELLPFQECCTSLELDCIIPPLTTSPLAEVIFCTLGVLISFMFLHLHILIKIVHVSDVFVVMCSYQLMQMCWQASPGNRASLRELRIMLLHLHSASRGDPDTTSFDQKWNQLMPRPNTEDFSAGSGNSSARAETVDVVDIDLGTPGGNSARPVGFESDLMEANTSPNHVQPPVMPSFEAKSPVNEMSLAAELGALGTFEAPRDDDDDDNIRFVRENAENSRASAHISVLAEVHSEKSDPQLADSLNVPLSDSLDITDQFASLNAESINNSAMSQTERYASYLKTVNTSAIEGDEDMVDDPKSKDSVLSEAL